MADRGSRVTALIVARNALATLPAAVRSVTRSAGVDWRCVVVDDASGDGTDAWLRDAAADPRIDARRGDGKGVVPARNLGLEACRGDVGDLIAILDADDLMRRDRLRAALRALERDPGLDAVTCHPRYFPRVAVSEGLLRYETWLRSIRTAEDLVRDRFVEMPAAHSGLVFRATVLKRLGYRDRGWPEDYDLLLRLLAGGGRVGVIPKRQLAWRVSSEGLSRRDPAYATEGFTRCKAEFLAAGPLRDRGDYVLWGFGNTARRLRRALEAHGKRAALIVDVDPHRVGQTIHGARVVGPEELPHPSPPILVSVAGPGRREESRARLIGTGRAEGADFLCVA